MTVGVVGLWPGQEYMFPVWLFSIKVGFVGLWSSPKLTHNRVHGWAHGGIVGVWPLFPAKPGPVPGISLGWVHGWAHGGIVGVWPLFPAKPGPVPGISLGWVHGGVHCTIAGIRAVFKYFKEEVCFSFRKTVPGWAENMFGWKLFR